MPPLHVPAIPQLRTRFRRVPAASRRGPLLTRTARPDSYFFLYASALPFPASASDPFCASMRARTPVHPPAPGLSWLPCTSLQSHSSVLGSGGCPPLHAVALSLRGQLARTQVFSLCARAPGSGRLRPPPFVHPCVPAPRLIPLRLGSSPCAPAHSPAPSSGPRPQPRTPPSVPRRLFFRPPISAPAAAPRMPRPRLIFCPRPAPCLTRPRLPVQNAPYYTAAGPPPLCRRFFLLKKAEAAY